MTMAKMIVLKNVFLRHKYKLLLTYSLFSLEMLGSLNDGLAYLELARGPATLLHAHGAFHIG